MGKPVNKKQLLISIVLCLSMGIICVLVYKAQIRGKIYQPTEYTMMTEHKDISEVVLSQDISELAEVFVCTVPELKSLSVEFGGENISDEARLTISLLDADTGELFYDAEGTVRSMLDSRIDKKLELKLPKTLYDSENRKLLLSWRLKEAGSTVLRISANQKQVIVSSFNEEDTGINVIYSLKYGDNKFLINLYILLCAALFAFVVLCYWMIIIRRLNVEQFFLPAALILGMIFQCLITVGGVPDEPGHLDTAYLYSNKILFVENTENPGTIYKRKCDAELSDMLVNGLESNSYYQLWTGTFEKEEDTELVEVMGVNSTNLVPGIVYMPMALGISFGRVFGLSAMLTFQLGRILNLLSFVLLTWTAIRLIPFGKNVLAMIAFLPITLQQGASASYDAVVNGLLFLFLGVCFCMWKKEQKERWELLLIILLAAFTAVIKGGVYLPILLLLVPVFFKKGMLESFDQRKKVLWMSAFLVTALLLISVSVIKFMPVLETFMQEGDTKTGSEAMYTIPYLICRPLKVIYIYWVTIVEKGDILLQGLLGGRLSWLDIRINWIFELPFLIGLLLMTNVEGDRYNENKKRKFLIAVVCGLSMVLIMMSMLVGYTKRSFDYIQGLQGRYFLPLFPIFLFLMTNQMVNVQKKQCSNIWMVMMGTEFMFVLQVAAIIE